eukprot:2800841-Prorocentrum_lima.AAC.1
MSQHGINQDWSYLNVPGHLKILLELGTERPMRETGAASSSGVPHQQAGQADQDDDSDRIYR